MSSLRNTWSQGIAEKYNTTKEQLSQLSDLFKEKSSELWHKTEQMLQEKKVQYAKYSAQNYQNLKENTAAIAVKTSKSGTAFEESLELSATELAIEAKEAVAEMTKKEIALRTEELALNTLAKKEVGPAQGFLRGASSTVATVILCHKTDNQNIRTVTKNTEVQKSLFSGFTFNLSSSLFRGCMMFGAAPVIQKMLSISQNQSLMVTSATDGMLSGIFMVVKQNMATRDDVKNAWEVMTKTPYEKLSKSFRNASLTGGLRNFVFGGVFFPIVMDSEKYIQDRTFVENIVARSVIGALAGAAALCFSYPIDVAQKWWIANPHLTPKQLVSRLWKEDAYPDFQRSLYRMVKASVAMNVGIYVGDQVFHTAKLHTTSLSFFKKDRAKSVPVSPEREMEITSVVDNTFRP